MIWGNKIQNPISIHAELFKMSACQNLDHSYPNIAAIQWNWIYGELGGEIMTLGIGKFLDLTKSSSMQATWNFPVHDKLLVCSIYQ